MANIAASDVTYTISKSSKMEDSRMLMTATLVFGNGVLTYPAGGVPITKGKLGCPTVIQSLEIIGNAGQGYVFQYDIANEKLMMLASTTGTTAAHTHDILLKDAAVADGATTRVNAGANLLGANTGGDLTVTGGGANGGVVSGGGAITATALAEPAGVAIAAQSIVVNAIGW